MEVFLPSAGLMEDEEDGGLWWFCLQMVDSVLCRLNPLILAPSFYARPAAVHAHARSLRGAEGGGVRGHFNRKPPVTFFFFFLNTD